MNKYQLTPEGRELLNRIKTWLWTAFWLGLTYFVDVLLQTLVGVSLPTITTDIGGMPIVINTAIPVGLVLNQVSKWLHNRNK